MDRATRLSILVIDDLEPITEVYSATLAEELGHDVDTASMPGEALRLADERLYDVVICDAKMPYKGALCGGVLLAEELVPRYGVNGVLLVSQVVDEAMVRAYSSEIPFLRKPGEADLRDWIAGPLLRKLARMVRSQFGFVAMPYGDKTLDALYRKYIHPAARDAGFRLRRVDEASFTKSIVATMFRMIADSKFVILVAADRNPNVFYEAGYAFALRKEVITCAPSASDLPFDIRGRRHIVYRRAYRRLRRELTVLLNGLRRGPAADG